MQDVQQCGSKFAVINFMKQYRVDRSSSKTHFPMSDSKEISFDSCRQTQLPLSYQKVSVIQREWETRTGRGPSIIPYTI